MCEGNVESRNTHFSVGFVSIPNSCISQSGIQI